MINSFLASIASTGMLRAPIRDNTMYKMNYISYYDKLVIELAPVVRDPAVRSPQSMSIPRALLRGIFPEFTLSTRRSARSLESRSIQCRFVYMSARKVYVCVLERSIETYLKYRTIKSFEKDIEQGETYDA